MAFHVNDVDYVEFSADDGSWVKVSSASVNPRTGAPEYFVAVDAKDFRDGPTEIRAVAYPKAGVPTVLSSLYLYANGGGSLKATAKYVATGGSDSTGDGSSAKPYGTIMKAANAIASASGNGLADGGIVYLKAGDHVWGKYSYGLRSPTRDAWLTIRAAPGVARDKVRIVDSTDSYGLWTKLVRIKDLTVKPNPGSVVLRSVYKLEDYLWVDGCEMVGNGTSVSTMFTNGWSGTYITDSLVRDSSSGWKGAIVARNVTVKRISEDAFSDSALCVNCTVESMDRTGTTYHPDVVQMYSRRNQMIFYGLKAVKDIGSQGLFTGNNIGIQDVAFVNCQVDNRNAAGRDLSFRVFQLGGTTTHLYVKDCTFNGPANWRTDQAFVANDVVVEDSKNTDGSDFRPSPGTVSGVTYR
jgi:hypothetical protein